MGGWDAGTERMHGKVVAGRPGGPTFACRKAGRINWGARQTAQPTVPAWETKISKLLAVKICAGCGGRRNSQPHRRVHWRDPQDPKTYTNLPTRESAVEGPNLLVGSGGSD